MLEVKVPGTLVQRFWLARAEFARVAESGCPFAITNAAEFDLAGFAATSFDIPSSDRIAFRKWCREHGIEI